MGHGTIADIARGAGVSTATVDRALNGRAGVSAANRQRVMQAARDLGYLPSEGMVQLPARPAHLGFLIPFGHNAFMRDVSAGIAGFAATLPMVASCTMVELPGIGPDALIPALEALPIDIEGVGLITTDHPGSRAAIARLCDAGVRVVTLASDVTGTPRSAYLGVDNRVAGRTAAQLTGMLAAGQAGSVALFLGAHAFHGHRERDAGFRAVMGTRFARLRLLPPVETGEDSARSRAAMAGLLRREPDLLGVYCVGAGRSGIVEALSERQGGPRPFVVLHELTDEARGWLERDLIDAVIDQNAQLMGEQAVIQLLGAIAAPTPLLPVKAIEPRIILRENLPARAQA